MTTWVLLIAIGPALASIPFDAQILEPKVLVLEGFDSRESCEAVRRLVVVGPDLYALSGCVPKAKEPMILPPMMPPPATAPEPEQPGEDSL